MGKTSRPVSHDHIGSARHGGMDRILSENAAEDGVGTLGLDTSDGIAQVKVFDRNFSVMLFAVAGDPLFEQKSDIFLEDVP